MISPVPGLNLPGQCLEAVQRIVRVVENVPMATNTFRLRLETPEVAQRILPGQFFMLRIPGRTDPLLGRPFALFDTYLDPHGQPAGIDLGYLVVGKMTSLLPQLKSGDSVELWGPLGNGFPRLEGIRHLACVAGGIGQTPFLAVINDVLGRKAYGTIAKSASGKIPAVSFCYGVRNQDYLAGVEWFQQTGAAIHLATDDGSAGHHGYVTQLFQQLLDSTNPPDAVFCCGPEPMLRATAKVCATANVRCWVSLETPMACGFGACFSCVTRVREPSGDWDYKRVCVEGPIFPAEHVVFE